MFIRLSAPGPEFVPKHGCVVDLYGPTTHIPALRYQTPMPLGRSDLHTYGPDRYGYTDRDDHRLALIGA